MTMQTTESFRTALRSFMAVLIGVALPSIVTGRAPLAFIFPLVGIIAVARVWRLRAEILPRLWPAPPLAWAILVMMVSFGVSALWTIDPAGSPRTWIEFAGILAVGTLVYLALDGDTRMIDIALKSAVSASVFGFLLVFLTIFVSHDFMSVVRMRDVVNADLARQAMKSYGSVLPLMIPLLIWCGWRLKGRWRWIAWALIAPNVATIPVLEAKAGLLGLAGAVAAVGFAWLLLRLTPRLRPGLVLVAVALTIGIAALVVSRLPAPPYKGRDSLRISTSLIDAHRQVIWGFSISFANDRPLFGYGLDTAGRLPGAKTVIPGFNQNYVPGHTHNWIIQLIVETGWIGLLSALIVIWLLLRRIWRGILDGYSGAWVAAAGSGAFFISSLVNFNVWAIWWHGIFYLLLALSLAAAPTSPRGRAAA